jgi:DNA-binding beta-propeller fold protein YncE
MTPMKLTDVEDTLRRAYADALAAVQRDDVSQDVLIDRRPGRPPRRAGPSGPPRRWVVAASAAAAVAVIALVAGLVLPISLQHGASLAAVPEHMAYVAANGEVIPVDLSSGTALRPIRLGVPGGTVGAVLAPGGRTVYVATTRGYVVPVDTATRKAEPAVRIGGIPQGMLMSPDGRTGYVIEPPYGVAVVNFATNRAAGFVTVSGAWNFALTPDGKTLYVVSWSGLVTPVETATLTTLRPVQTPGYPGPAAHAERPAPLTECRAGRRPACVSRTPSPRPGDWPSGSALLTVPSIAVAPDGKTAYVVGVRAGATDVLTPISTASNTALAPIRIPDGMWGAPISFSPDGRTGYLAGSVVTAVNLVTGAVSWTARLPVRPGWPFGYETAVSPDGRNVYALDSDSGRSPGTVYRIPAATGVPRGAQIRTPWVSPLGALDDEIGLSPDGKTLYVQSFPANNQATVALFDASTGRAGRVIHTGWPGTILFGPS